MPKYKILVAEVYGAGGFSFKEGDVVDGSRLSNISGHLAAKDIEEITEEIQGEGHE